MSLVRLWRRILGRRARHEADTGLYWRSDDIRLRLDQAAVRHVERYQFAASLLRERRHRLVCDVACGSGYGAWILRDEGTRVVGVDRAPDVVAYAKAAFPGSLHLAGDATRLPFRDAAFGAVVSFETLEHLADPVAAVAEYRRCLEPGGVLVCSIPIGHPDRTWHKRVYDVDAVRSLLESAGWSHLQYHAQDRDRAGIRSLAEARELNTLLTICEA